VDRYSFNVRDFHPLLLAGLPAHSKNQHKHRHRAVRLRADAVEKGLEEPSEQ